MRHRSPESLLSPLEKAIWQTIAYVDGFDYPLTAVEIQRYLEGMPAPLCEVEAALANGRLLPDYLSQSGPFYMLAGREETVAIRQRRAQLARRLWPDALRYGRILGQLPFVRMVAVTGSLAMDNVNEKADIDYLVVTRNGRLWLSRALLIIVVRLAARRGLTVCPNYILSESSLRFSDQNLYTAHEVAQMIPLSGTAVYQQLRQTNEWTHTYLPNAVGAPPREMIVADGRYLRRHLLELPLRTPLGSWLEQWEMKRKIQKFSTHQQANTETNFTADCCKGHFDAHKTWALSNYHKRRLEVGD